MPLCECSRDDSPFHTLPFLTFLLVFIRLSQHECYAEAGAECVMEIFSFHPRCLLKTDFPYWRNAFSNYRVKSSQHWSLGTTAVLREAFPPTAGPWHKQDALPFRIFRDRSRESFARGIKRTRGTITYARSCQ